MRTSLLLALLVCTACSSSGNAGSSIGSAGGNPSRCNDLCAAQTACGGGACSADCSGNASSLRADWWNAYTDCVSQRSAACGKAGAPTWSSIQKACEDVGDAAIPPGTAAANTNVICNAYCDRAAACKAAPGDCLAGCSDKRGDQDWARASDAVIGAYADCIRRAACTVGDPFDACSKLRP